MPGPGAPRDNEGMPTSRRRRSYAHRLVRAVQNSRDVTNEARQGVRGDERWLSGVTKVFPPSDA